MSLDKMREKLERKRLRVLTRYRYYELKNTAQDFGISTPPSMEGWQSCLGWCAKGVDSLADRMIFRGFENDDFGLTDIFRDNNMDILPDAAILAALIGSCAFVYVSSGAGKTVRLQIVDGANATGEMDPITGLLREGYAVLERDEYDKILQEAWFLPGVTRFYQSGKETMIIKNAAPYPLLVPIVYRPDARRPFGHSRISRASMSIVCSALRTIKRGEISAEFYSYPQKYVLGTDPNMEPINKWRASMSSLLEFTLGENGEKPTVGQFTQQSMQPHADQLRMFASLFAGENGLTLDDLGFATENPSSAEAIKAAHEGLRLTARKAQRTFGTGFLNVGYLATCILDNYAYERSAFRRVLPKWEPLFEPDFAAFAAIGDGLGKLAAAAPGYVGPDTLQDILGIAPSTMPFTSET